MMLTVLILALLVNGLIWLNSHILGSEVNGRITVKSNPETRQRICLKLEIGLLTVQVGLVNRPLRDIQLNFEWERRAREIGAG